jgi:uncharacterized protein YpmB
MSKTSGYSVVKGKDNAGCESYISVERDGSKIKVYSPEDASDVVFTVKEAKELIQALQSAILSK